MALSQLSVTMSPIFALFQITILKNINCFFTWKNMFFRNTFKEEIRVLSALAEQASSTGQPGWCLGLRVIWWQQAWLLSQPDQRHTPGLRLGAALVLLSWLPRQAADTWAELSCWLHLQRQHLAHTLGTLGVCKAFLGSSLAFEVRKFVAEREEKGAEYRVTGWGPGYHRSRAPFPCQSWTTETQNLPTPLSPELCYLY